MTVRAAIALAAAAGVSGCSLLPNAPVAQEVPAYFAPAEELRQVQRIMILPFDAVAGVSADTDLLRSAFAAELAKMKRFEIMPLPAHAADVERIHEGVRRGRISVEALAEIGARYRLDGVLLATVTGYRPYKPPRVGLRVQLVSLHSARAVWAAEVFYDAADTPTVRDIEHYSSTFLADDDTLHGWEFILLSPERFATFAAHRVVGTWRNAAAPGR